MTKEETDTRTSYEEVQKQHHLPPFDTLNAEFDIETIESEKRLIKEVAKRIFERSDMFRKVLETLIHPESSLLAMQEAESLSDAEHEQIQHLLQCMMQLDRRMLVAELDNTDKAYIAFIHDATKEWTAIKKDLIPVATKMQASWNNHHKAKPTQHYLG